MRRPDFERGLIGVALTTEVGRHPLDALLISLYKARHQRYLPAAVPVVMEKSSFSGDLRDYSAFGQTAIVPAVGRLDLTESLPVRFQGLLNLDESDRLAGFVADPNAGQGAEGAQEQAPPTEHIAVVQHAAQPPTEQRT